MNKRKLYFIREGNCMELQRIVNQEMKEIETYITQLEKRQTIFPEGKLNIRHNGNSVQYIQRVNPKEKSGRYIKRREEKLARKLAQKEYEAKALSILKKHYQGLQAIGEESWKDEVRKIYDELAVERKIMTNPLFETDEEFITQWFSEEYQGKVFEPNTPEIYTDRGERVRSKSEKMIADKLNQMKIPYKYECPLCLYGVGVIYPDFTLLDVQKRREVYYEHLGRMDDPDYSLGAVRKINSYEKNGYFLGSELLISLETIQNPLDMRGVERLLERRILHIF